MPKCSTCRERVLIRGISINDQVWHKACFRCTKCSLQLKESTGVIFASQPYCTRHVPTPNLPVIRKPVKHLSEPWYYGPISRQEAEALLKKDGDFLVRWSESQWAYIVSVSWKSTTSHAIINEEGDRYMFNGEMIPTVKDWVQRHIDTGFPIVRNGAILKNPIVEEDGMYVYPDPVEETTPKAIPTNAPPPLPVKRRLAQRPSLENQFQAFQVIEASIDQVKADIIVSTVGVDLNLRSGSELSRALVQAGGEGIQNELSADYKTVKVGDILTTKGYKLNCIWIVHVVLRKWDAGGEVTQILDLRHILKNMFLIADEMAAKSIAIPAIGTEVLGYPRNIVAELIFSEASEFLDANPTTRLREVILIVNPGDGDLRNKYQQLLQRQDDVEERSEQMKQQAANALMDLVKGLSELKYSAGWEPPKHWTSSPSSEKPYEKFELLETETEYEKVLNLMDSRQGNQFVKYVYKIERIENRPQYRKYEMSKEELEKGKSLAVKSEEILYHGTSYDAVENILISGFNRNYGGKNAKLYGTGVYFAHNFSFSAQDKYSPPNNGRKYIFQSRVLTGRYCKGTEGMPEPPHIDETKQRRYDSAVDDTDNPKIFVKFRDFEAYPEYLITFYSEKT